MAKRNRQRAMGARRGSARVASLLESVRRMTESMTRRDVQDWRKAWQMAVNVDNPSRLRLYDIYRDTLTDLHLSGCIEQRRGFVMARSFKLVDAEGEADREALHLLDQTWFRDLLRLCHDSIFWGHSLVELGDVVRDGDGCPCYDGVTLIPRRHVIPEFHVVVGEQGEDPSCGTDYRQPLYAGRLIEAGSPDSLGLLLKAAPQAIAKKNAMNFWDAFAEIFGMPVRWAKTASRDPAERRRLRAMLENAANAMALLTDMDTQLEFVESSRGDAYNVYDRRIARANSEMSKLVIGQTMTIEDGSSLSQSQTHLEVFENLVESDRAMLRDIVNNQLLPRMAAHGFAVSGLRFEWDDAVDYSPEQQVAYETMIADRYEVDPEYFADKYGMPVGKRIGRTPADGDDGGETGRETGRDFFA